MFIKVIFHSDVLSDIVSDNTMLFERSTKRTAGVPRGLLRFMVLKYLVEKPMSGAEIVETIVRETGGKWKPSSGSIYPLLGWLQDKEFASAASVVESGMKRYSLTDNGKEFFKEQVRVGQKFLEKMEWLAPMLLEGFDYGTDRESLLCAKESAKKVLETFIELDARRKHLTEQNIKEIVRILDNSNSQLKKIVEKIDRKN